MKWIVKEKSPAEYRAQFPNYPDFFVDLLWNRGLKTPDEVERFLNPDYDHDLHDPFLLKDIKKSAERIWQAIEQKEKIMVYGDYDADGICASVILHEFFDKIDIDHGLYLPDRNIEGYGLNDKAIEKIISEGYKLIITLDCGTTNISQIAGAREAGVDVLVVDHHRVVDELPPAYALINPYQLGDTYPFKGLCGTGLAFKLFQALARDPRAGKRWADGKEKWLLDLVAIATVADMVPLVDENRTLVSYGLFVLAQTQRPSLAELMKVARLSAEFNREKKTTNLNAHDLGFLIGPRINAAGRMDHASRAYNLLLEKDPVRARLATLEIEENNSRRRKEIEYIEADARSRINLVSPPDFIVEASTDWPPGTLGLVANRIKDEISRPVLLAHIENGEAKASLRSPEGLNVVKALESIKTLLISFGGHPAAAGCRFEIKNIDSIRKGLNRYAARNLTDETREAKLEIDAELSVADLTIKNVELIRQLEPFGMANQEPRLLLRNIVLQNVRILGANGQHAKLTFANPSHGTLTALMFFHNGEAGYLSPGERYDVVGELSVNEWNGTRSPQFKIIDIRITK